MKTRIYAIFLALLMTITLGDAYAVTNDDRKARKERVAAMTESQKAARLEEIRSRVDEIRAMDRSELTKADRKALKKELRDMNREARATKGVYLSIGAIIIIILLLILIL